MRGSAPVAQLDRVPGYELVVGSSNSPGAPYKRKRQRHSLAFSLRDRKASTSGDFPDKRGSRGQLKIRIETWSPGQKFARVHARPSRLRILTVIPAIRHASHARTQSLARIHLHPAAGSPRMGTQGPARVVQESFDECPEHARPRSKRFRKSALRLPAVIRNERIRVAVSDLVFGLQMRNLLHVLLVLSVSSTLKQCATGSLGLLIEEVDAAL